MSPEGLARLVAEIEADARLLEAEPLTGGVSADVWRVRFVADGRERSIVVRRRPGVEPAAVEREAALCTALHDRGFAVPPALWTESTGDLLGAPAWAMPWRDGTTDVSFTNHRLQTLATWVRRVHATALEGLPDLPTRDDPRPELAGWLLDEVADVRPVLAALPWPTARRVLVHGDLWSGNLLWRDDRLVAMLDWEDAAVGDPLSDLAGSRLELVWRGGPALGDAWIGCFPGVDRVRLAVWELYCACAAWRFMGDWGWSAEQLAATRAATERFADRAASVVRREG